MLNSREIADRLEAALLAYAAPLSVEKLLSLFELEDEPLSQDDIERHLHQLQAVLDERDDVRALVEVASGWRFQIRQPVADTLSSLWESKPGRYSRALLETLALIAYRQPVTRGEIEEVRGVAVSSNIVRTLEERHWIRVIGHKDVPGKPAMYATTRNFLDDLGLRNLSELPALIEQQESMPVLSLPDKDTVNTQVESVSEEGFGIEELSPLDDDSERREELFASLDETLEGLRDDFSDLETAELDTDSPVENDIETQE